MCGAFRRRRPLRLHPALPPGEGGPHRHRRGALALPLCGGAPRRADGGARPVPGGVPGPSCAAAPGSARWATAGPPGCPDCPAPGRLELPPPEGCWQISGDNCGGFFLTVWERCAMSARPGVPSWTGSGCWRRCWWCASTPPLWPLPPLGDFWLTRVLARVAVPFFLMVSGYFLARDGWRCSGRFLKKTLALYGAAVLLYLPLNWYSGGFSPLAVAPAAADRRHLLPPVVFPRGACWGYWSPGSLARLGLRAALAVAAAPLPGGPGRGQLLRPGRPAPRPGGHVRRPSSAVYLHPQRAVLHPAVPAAGGGGNPLGRRASALGTVLSLAAMTAEAFWLRSLGLAPP